MTYEMIRTECGAIEIVDENGLIVDSGFYDYEGSDDFWMQSGIYEIKADILAFWNGQPLAGQRIPRKQAA